MSTLFLRGYLADEKGESQNPERARVRSIITDTLKNEGYATAQVNFLAKKNGPLVLEIFFSQNGNDEDDQTPPAPNTPQTIEATRSIQKAISHFGMEFSPIPEK